jgi:hypothetical protein
VSGQLHASAAFPPEKEPPGTHCSERWLGPRAGMDAVAKRNIPAPGETNPGRPARRCWMCISYTYTHARRFGSYRLQVISHYTDIHMRFTFMFHMEGCGLGRQQCCQHFLSTTSSNCQPLEREAASVTNHLRTLGALSPRPYTHAVH